uniref:Ribosome biogenesis GTPase RsgA n=1 Tax=Parastrongyloides trichosuri TaxID=131310 RepID=A0A0N4ZZK0_PARTI
MKSIDRCGKSSDKLKIISKNRNGKLSIVEKILSNNLRSKNVYYFFDEKTIMNNTEFLTPCGVADVYLAAPTISIVGFKLIEITENDTIKITSPVKVGKKKYFFKLMSEESQDLANFYQGEKVLIKKMLFRNGKAEYRKEKGIEASENFIVAGYEILEISYK